MNQRSLLCLLLALGLPLILKAEAAEFEIRTADGQTIQGEYLGLEEGNVKLRTKYGILQVASKDVLTMTEIKAKPAPAEQPAGEQPAEQPAAEKPLPPKAVAPPHPPAQPAKAEATENTKAEPPAPPLTFPETRMPDPVGMATARAALEPAPPEPSKQVYLQIDRAVGNFADTNSGNRRKSIRMLQSYGRMAEPFIEGAYTNPTDLSVRVELLEALAIPGRFLTTPIFAKAHSQALAALSQAAAGPPPAPDPFAKGAPMTRNDQMQLAASDVLALEDYISTAGGPYNTLFLLDVYRKRYTSDKTDPLLLGLARDRARLASAAADATRSRSAWEKDERLGVIELALPMLFKDDESLASLAQALLTKLLPTGHPKWSADEENWVEWWKKARAKIK